MSLTSIANDIKNAVTEGHGWLAKAAGEHVPALVAEAERLQSSAIVQAVEGVDFPPEVEQEIVNVIKAFAALLATVPAAPAVPEVPEQPADPANLTGPPDDPEPSAS